MKTFLLLTSSLVLLLLCGCTSARTSENKSAETVATAHEATIKQALRAPAPSPLPTSRNVTVSGVSNVVTVTETIHDAPRMHRDSEPEGYAETTEIHDGASASGSARIDDTKQSKFGLPLSVSLSLGVAALFGVGFLIRWGLRSSASAKAAYTMADEALANRIRAFRAKATVSTDPREIAAHQSEIAELESARGKLAAS